MTRGNERGQPHSAWRRNSGVIADRPLCPPASSLAETAPLQRSRVAKKLNPDQKGAKQLAGRYGDRLVCVRYRTDAESGRRFTTVEIVVDERRPIAPEPATVLVRIGWDETELRQAIKAQGGIWIKERKLWRAPRTAVRQLGLKDRIVREGS